MVVVVVVVVVVLRSSGEQNMVPRKDDHTYLAFTPVTTMHELSRLLPFRQTVGNSFAEC